jgi:lysozyme
MHKIVDVSNNNGRVDFRAVKAAGARGVWIKVTEGTSFVDPDYRANREAAQRAGLQVGGYHFAHAANHPGAEVDFFLRHLVLEPGDLLPALDVAPGGCTGCSQATIRAYTAGALAELKQRIGEPAVRYAGSYFMRENGLAQLGGVPWIPSYGARPAFYPWRAWQFTDGQPQYPGAICGLDTSYVPSLALVTYKAHPARKAAGRLATIVIVGGRLVYPLHPSPALRAWWRRIHERRIPA